MKRTLYLSIATTVILIATFLLVPVAEAGCEGDGANFDCPDGNVVTGPADNDVVVGADNGFTDNTVDGYLDLGPGNDTLVVTGVGTVDGSVYGASGDDNITVDGEVGGDVRGGPNEDTIVINGHVGGEVDGASGSDNITINGTVDNDVQGAGGDDVITIAGHVGGNVIANQNMDTVILKDGAEIDGYIDGGAPNSGDTLVFDFTMTIGEDEEASTIEALQNAFDSGNGQFAGYTFYNFENLLESLHFHIYSGSDLIDCGKDPYLGQRPFNQYCEPYTGDPNESALDGLIYGETDGSES